eukprot:s627_g40.t1
MVKPRVVQHHGDEVPSQKDSLCVRIHVLWSPNTMPHVLGQLTQCFARSHAVTGGTQVTGILQIGHRPGKATEDSHLFDERILHGSVKAWSASAFPQHPLEVVALHCLHLPKGLTSWHYMLGYINSCMHWSMDSEGDHVLRPMPFP